MLNVYVSHADIKSELPATKTEIHMTKCSPYPTRTDHIPQPFVTWGWGGGGMEIGQIEEGVTKVNNQ